MLSKTIVAASLTQKDKATMNDVVVKIAFIFSFFQLKIKQSAQSHLASCEIKGDLEGYFCRRRW